MSKRVITQKTDRPDKASRLQNQAHIYNEYENSGSELLREEREASSMNTIELILVAVLLIGGAVYFGLRRLIASTEIANVTRMEETIRSAFVDVAAHHLQTSREEMQEVLSEAGPLTPLGQQLSHELLSCRLLFSPPVHGKVRLMLIISWQDGEVTKVEQEHVWETLPEKVRAFLIQNRLPYETLWVPPGQKNSSKERAI